MVVVVKSHSCRFHHGDPVKIGQVTVMAGGIHLSKATLTKTDVLVTLCYRSPTNLHRCPEVEEHIRIPLEDFGGIPDTFVADLEREVIPALEAEKQVTFHCEGGFGRTGSALAALIALLEPDIEDPVAAVRKRYCPRAVETKDQENGVRKIREMVLARRRNQKKEGSDMSDQKTTDRWYMAGTDYTGEYRVIAMNDAGKIGVRPLGNHVRIRIEPCSPEAAQALAGTFSLEQGWKQPDMLNPRFSLFTTRGEDAVKTVEDALRALAKTGGKLERNTAQDARLWRGRHVRPLADLADA